MNVELALAALEDAKANPDQFDMNCWFSSSVVTEFEKDGPNFLPPCGTTACYAGFAALRAAPIGTRVVSGYLVQAGDSPAVHVEHYAAKALDITEAQANILFYLGGIEQVEAAVKYLADNPDASVSTLAGLNRDDAW